MPNETKAVNLIARIYRRWYEATDQIPGVPQAREGLHYLEERFLFELKHRLDQLRAEEGDGEGRISIMPVRRSSGFSRRFQRLLDQSLKQRHHTAKRELLHFLLDRLQPDEARILALLSEGGLGAVCHINATALAGLSSSRVMSYASRLGREAGATLAEYTPFYIHHLISLGLLETGPRDKALAKSYEMIESDAPVRKIVSMIEEELNLRVSVERLTVRLTPLGEALWQAYINPEPARSEEDAEDEAEDSEQTHAGEDEAGPEADAAVDEEEKH